MGKRYRPPIPWLSLLEAVLALYCVYGVSLFIQRSRLVDPFLLLYTMGFASVALLSLWETLCSTVKKPQAVRDPWQGEEEPETQVVRLLEETQPVTAAVVPVERRPIA